MADSLRSDFDLLFDANYTFIRYCDPGGRPAVYSSRRQQHADFWKSDSIGPWSRSSPPCERDVHRDLPELLAKSFGQGSRADVSVRHVQRAIRYPLTIDAGVGIVTAGPYLARLPL